VQKRGMAQRFGWDTAAERYLALYSEALGPAPGRSQASA
jgi:glycogen synthase